MIAWKMLMHRKAGFAGAFVALLCAAALVTACGMLLETGLRGGVAPERYAGTPVIVAGDQYARMTKESGKEKAKPLSERRWIPSTLAEEISRIPGVQKVVPEVTFSHAGFTAHGWESAELTPFTLAKGRVPKARDEVVVDARHAGTAVPGYRVVGVTAQALPSQDTLFFSTDEARRLSGRQGLVTAIGVFPQVNVAVKGALAYTGDARGPVEFVDAENARIRLISLGGALGGTSLLVAILVVVGTFALSIQQRQREIALLRAIAATPRQIKTLITREALLISLVAGLLGSGAGILLGAWLHGRFVSLGAVPANLGVVVSPFPAAAALLATVVAALVAARVSARRTASIRPVEALGEAVLPAGRLPWVRLVAGLLVVAGAAVLTVVLSNLRTESASSPITMVTALLWTVAVALLAPVFAIPFRLPGVTGFLARRNLRASSRRMASVITPLALMTAMSCTILFVQTTMGHATQGELDAGITADHVITGAPVSAVREVPGVRAATALLRTSVQIDLDRYGAQAVTPEGLDQTVDLGVVAGSLADFGADSVALSRTAADGLDVGVGDRIPLVLGDGTPAEVEVVAVYARGLGFGDLTLSHALVSGHVDDARGTVLVAGGTRAELESALPGAAVLDRVAAVESGAVNAAVNYVAMGLIIAFCAIAMVNTLAMSTSARSRELALLRLVGTTRRQALRMLRTETATSAAIALVLGTAISLVTLAAFSKGMTGSALPYIPPFAYLGVIAAVMALALAATAIPARLTLSAQPTEALGARE